MSNFDGRGFPLHFADEGRGDPVVFLAGYVMDGHLFDAQVGTLQATHRCVVLDRRGHGESGCPPGPWTMADLVDDVIALVEHLDIAPAHFVGMSLGGAEMSRVTLQRPELVRSLVYIDAPADPRLPAGAEFDIEDIAANGLSDELLDLATFMLYGERFRAEHPDEVAADIARIGALPRTALVEGFRINMTAEPVLDRLPTLTVPALVLHGGADIALPMSEAEQVAAALGTHVVVIGDAGHVTPREAPDVVTAAIARFLTTVPDRPSSAAPRATANPLTAPATERARARATPEPRRDRTSKRRSP